MSSGTKSFFATFVFVFIFVLITVPSAASVFHRVGFQGDHIMVNSSFITETEEPTGGTRITIGQEEDMDVVSVESSSGDASYTYRNESLVVEVDSTFPRKEHNVEVRWRAGEGVEEPFPGLHKLDVGLFGFPDEETMAVIESPDILSWYEPISFRSQYFNKSLRFKGEGHLWLRGYMSDEGKGTDTYYYFGDHNLSVAEELVPLVEYVAGTSNPHKRMPVVVLDDEVYDEKFTQWSKGTYETGGLIAIRDSLEGSNKITTVLHETTHGFNSRALKWDRTKTDYYDEGMAKFVELLVSESIGSPRSEIFGEEVLFREDGKRYSLSSRSSADELWSYYENEGDWIEHWSPRKKEFSDRRTFGYALSELIIRKKVDEEGVDSLRGVRANLSAVERRINDPDEKAKIMRSLLNLRPCGSGNRTEFESCLDKINSQEFDLHDMELNHSFESEMVEIKIEDKGSLKKPGPTENMDLIIENFLLNIKRLFRGVSVWISKRL